VTVADLASVAQADRPALRANGALADRRSVPDVAEPWQPACPQSLRAAILTTVPALPPVALTTMVVTYVLPGDFPLRALDPLLGGLLITALFCALAGLVLRFVVGATSADQANATSFHQLRERLHELDARLEVAAQQPDPSPAACIARRHAQTARAQIGLQLEQAGLDWVRATGYISIWKLLHRAEESMLLVDPVHAVVGAALFDELRLTGAAITNGDQLRSRLRRAVTSLSATASGYLVPVPGATGPGNEVKLSSDLADTPDPESVSRTALRDVRRAINEFRDGSFEAMVRTRNHLLATLTLTGVAGVLIAATAISSRERTPLLDPTGDPIVGAAVFYLVGALVGLFNRLYGESGRADDVEDYGLTAARIALTPVLSGLAAVAGVAITALLAGGTNLAGLVSAGGGASSASAGVASLANIYSLSANEFGIVVAAVFGLTPALLIGALQEQADRYRDKIQSTTAHSR
jgi:hypothetical protein